MKRIILIPASSFNGRDPASGIYYYQLVAGEYREVKKVIIIR